MPNPNNVQKKFNPGDRVRVEREALVDAEHLFRDGFDTLDGTVKWVRADVTYPENVLVDYIYTVEMDVDPSVANLQFKTEELKLVLPVAIKQLDIIIRNLDNEVTILRTYRNARARELGVE